MRLRNNKGFSLVELLIVIAVTAILVSIGGATLFKYIRKSKISHDISNADTIANAAITALKEQDINNEVRLKGGLVATALPDGTFISTTDAPLFMSALNQYCGSAPKMKYHDNGAEQWMVEVDAGGTGVIVSVADAAGTTKLFEINPTAQGDYVGY